MDIFTVIYYGLICGVLGISAPVLQNRLFRFAAGIGVGVVAATLLPVLRTMITGY